MPLFCLQQVQRMLSNSICHELIYLSMNGHAGCAAPSYGMHCAKRAGLRAELVWYSSCSLPLRTTASLTDLRCDISPGAST